MICTGVLSQDTIVIDKKSPAANQFEVIHSVQVWMIISACVIVDRVKRTANQDTANGNDAKP